MSNKRETPNKRNFTTRTQKVISSLVFSPSLPALGISQLMAEGKDLETARCAVKWAEFFAGRRGMTAFS